MPDAENGDQVFAARGVDVCPQCHTRLGAKEPVPRGRDARCVSIPPGASS